jgi:peptidoglycan biosynthesis protein MviN/MurJ (putative lipid II flippase)
VWLALLGLAHGMSSFAGLVETLFYVKRPTLNVVNAVVTIIVQAIVSLLLIPRMGVTGAALGMLAGFASQAVLRFIEMRHVFGWSWPWHSLTRPVVAFVAAIVPGALIRLFVPGPWGEAASATLFVLLYAAAWSRMGADPADREIWRRLRARKAIDAVPDAQPVAS